MVEFIFNLLADSLKFLLLKIKDVYRQLYNLTISVTFFLFSKNNPLKVVQVLRDFYPH